MLAFRKFGGCRPGREVADFSGGEETLGQN
jgi:hypothetical protein